MIDFFQIDGIFQRLQFNGYFHKAEVEWNPPEFWWKFSKVKGLIMEFQGVGWKFSEVEVEWNFSKVAI